MAGHRTSLRVYRALLLLYPAAFRTRFGEEIVQLFGDQLGEAGGGPARLGNAATWARGLGDLIVTATAERLRGDRTIGDSPGEPPSGAIRLLGIIGVLGGIGILAAFVVQQLIFETLPWLITVRIVLFNLGAIAIVIALQGRVIGWAAALANAWYAGMTMLPVIGWAPFAGDHHIVGFVAGLAMWITDAAFGLLVARRGGLLRLAGLTLTVGSVLALLGIDRLGLTNGDASAFFVPLALAGQGIGGIAWVLLGIDVATRRRPRPATS
jgi:hypothetical protein